MKYLIFTLAIAIVSILSFFIYQFFKPRKAIDRGVVVVQTGNKITVDYIDSFLSLYDIKTKVNVDTLNLTILVSRTVQHNTVDVPVPSNVHFVRYGDTIKIISELPVNMKGKVWAKKD